VGFSESLLGEEFSYKLEYGGSLLQKQEFKDFFLQLKATLDKWWLAEGESKLRSVYKAVPTFIIWQI
ncbi:hypothetical protein HAX54_001991, partial [Datura stramonium]|nr:hypothetical protein [Datura stramonium]